MKGKRTYLLAGLGGVMTVLHTLGVVPDDWFATIMALAGSGAAASLRAGMKGGA